MRVIDESTREQLNWNNLDHFNCWILIQEMCNQWCSITQTYKTSKVISQQDKLTSKDLKKGWDKISFAPSSLPNLCEGSLFKRSLMRSMYSWVGHVESGNTTGYRLISACIILGFLFAKGCSPYTCSNLHTKFINSYRSYIMIPIAQNLEVADLSFFSNNSGATYFNSSTLGWYC